ncbi:hypothetical protein [Streptomyces sp. NBC_00690]|uniref:hypothetical protein n=1 Tax=Streptomyces sp. NBC_00690 TaxID=2975808 RepID=UPI002E2A5536|nr:hypothetical protein [Streptomyces sp. NBC_00690]
MGETDTMSDGATWYERVSRVDTPVAGLVAAGNTLLCGALLLMMITSGINFGPPGSTQEAEAAATSELVKRIYVGWLVGGLLLFASCRLPRAVLSHLVSMAAPPVTLLAFFAAVI